ncbi:MAG TPA: hypothetical protein VFN22_08580 [Gemmatimonadales bacterium]|nr:hypothetical protein [Gemmatimonadales bacterium]
MRRGGDRAAQVLRELRGQLGIDDPANIVLAEDRKRDLQWGLPG